MLQTSSPAHNQSRVSAMKKLFEVLFVASSLLGQLFRLPDQRSITSQEREASSRKRPVEGGKVLQSAHLRERKRCLQTGDEDNPKKARGDVEDGVRNPLFDNRVDSRKSLLV